MHFRYYVVVASACVFVLVGAAAVLLYSNRILDGKAVVKLINNYYKNNAVYPPTIGAVYQWRQFKCGGGIIYIGLINGCFLRDTGVNHINENGAGDDMDFFYISGSASTQEEFVKLLHLTGNRSKIHVITGAVDSTGSFNETGKTNVNGGVFQ